MPVIPFKTYLYGAILALLVSLFIWYTIHERSAGEAAVVAADTRTALVAQAKDLAITAAAQSSTTRIGDTYEKVVTSLPSADIGLVCIAPGGSAMPETAGDRPATDGTPAVGKKATFDPSGPVIDVGKDDDALITALQAQIVDLVSRMNGSTQ